MPDFGPKGWRADHLPGPLSPIGMRRGSPIVRRVSHRVRSDCRVAHPGGTFLLERRLPNGLEHRDVLELRDAENDIQRLHDDAAAIVVGQRPAPAAKDRRACVSRTCTARPADFPSRSLSQAIRPPRKGYIKCPDLVTTTGETRSALSTSLLRALHPDGPRAPPHSGMLTTRFSSRWRPPRAKLEAKELGRHVRTVGSTRGGEEENAS